MPCHNYYYLLIVIYQMTSLSLRRSFMAFEMALWIGNLYRDSYFCLSLSFANVISSGGFLMKMVAGVACRGSGTCTTVPFSSFDKILTAATNSSFEVYLKRNEEDCLNALAVTMGPGKFITPSRMSPAVG